ncbi:palmitoyltransferase ERF2 [Poronia punctata]|nr:palmitoyltransferase ERF2 [Poronia punctata]
MASNSQPASPISPVSIDGNLATHMFPPAPPSVISSRMTDIASEDGDEPGISPKKGGRTNESRPGTARTGMSSKGGPWSQSLPLRKGMMQRGSVSGSIGSSRPLSSASRSHAPIASQAFFRPLSSQKLQAQRGSRPPSFGLHRPSIDDLPDEDDQSHIAPHEILAPVRAGPSHEPANERIDDGRPPPSRDTEMTEPYDRITTTTSPTHGHYPPTSVADSTRPLHQKQTEERGLSLTLDTNSPRNIGSDANPTKSSRSFGSSLFASGMGGSNTNAPNRDTHGAEKLPSGASSPRLARGHSHLSEENSKARGQNTMVGRNHEYFEGNTVFCIGGRLQNTRHRPINIGTGFLIVLPAGLFFGACAPYLWHNLSPAVPIVFAYIFFITMSSFLRASGSDPGILPRNLHQLPPMDENEDPLRLAPPTNDWTLIKTVDSSIAAMEVPTKFCRTCNIWRPPRAHHCRLCDNCIETQDHHCVWINNCVGRRNYRYFFTFVTSGTIMALYVIGASLAQIVIYSRREDVSFGQAADHFRVALALVIYGVLGFIYPVALTGYHLFLMARGETTREFINSHKLLKKDRYRAFTQASMWRNWVVVLCRPRPPTYYRFKDRYQEGDQRLGERRRLQSEGILPKRQEYEMQVVRPFQGPLSLRNGTSAPVNR